MPWSSVSEFVKSEAFARMKEMHGWTQEKLGKFVSVFGEVFARAKRNGADDPKAESLAFPIAIETARRAASAETMSRLEPTRHYFAAMAKVQAARSADSPNIGGDEYRFGLLRSGLPLMRNLVAGLAVNWNHQHAQQIGAIHDILLREHAPPEVQAVTDPDVPFLFVASYRSDIPAESRNEIRISAEWLTTLDKEVIPMTFAASHDPLNGPELGIQRLDVAVASMLDEKVAESASNVSAEQSAKTFQEEHGSTSTKETPPMADEAPNPSTLFEAKVASLTAELDNEKKTRKVAELNYAAMKAEFETTKKVVEELKAAATEQMADMAALSLVHEGKATADQASYFASLYKELGREKFETLVAALPRSTLGAYAIKAAAQAVQSPEQVKEHKDRLSRLLREA